MGSLGFCFWRNNGLLAYGLALIAMIIIFRKQIPSLRDIFLITGIVLLLAFVFEYLVLSFLKIKQPDKIEVLSIPEQQVVHAVINGEVDEETIDELNKFINVDRAREEYVSHISDPIKLLIRQETADYFNNNFLDFLKLWMKIGKRNIKQYFESWIEMTRGYWNGGYKYWIWPGGIQDNRFGIKHSTYSDSLEQTYRNWFWRVEENKFYEPFMSIGLHFWIVFFSLGIAIMKKDKAGVMLCLFPIAIVLTLLLGTSVFCEFRYVYSLFTSAPIIFASIFRLHCKFETDFN